MAKYVVATIKSWNIENFEKLEASDEENQWHLMTEKAQLTPDAIKEIEPDMIFFPHWSWIIPAEIYENYECVVFHMTDLPFGRGGSPLQNLISRGIYDTKISAIRVDEGLDTGDIYMKRPFDFSCGSAEELFRKASDIVFEMIPLIISTRPVPVPQEGEPVVFSRRKPRESLLPKTTDPRKLYDHIRMLDAEGYPKAFIEWGDLRIEFSKASLSGSGISAKATIITLNNDQNKKSSEV